MTTCDVLVVGGGPAGSSCARALTRAGMDVVVIDRKPFPRDKLCAGWITPQVLDALELGVEEYAGTGRVIQPLTGFQVSRFREGEARVAYDRVVSYGIRRCEFDHFLLDRSGARLRLGEPLQTLERERNGWTANGNLRASVVVGAGGHFCPVARRLGAELGQNEPVIAAQEVEFEMTPTQRVACRIDAAVPEIYFERDLKGYGWVFRKGDFLNVGLGRQGNAGLSEHVARFLAFLAERGKLPPGFPDRLRGHPYLLYDEAPRPLAGAAALLVGDAAGLAYPRSGEGIRPAIESGMLAAETLLEASGAYGTERLAPYERRIVERFGPRRRQRAITDLLPDSMLQSLAGRLFAIDWFARRVVLNEWFFHADQPSLRPAASATSPPSRVAVAAAR